MSLNFLAARRLCAALDEVLMPYLRRMLGDGLAIDPTSGVVVAPCDGEIVTLRTAATRCPSRPQGIDVLIPSVSIPFNSAARICRERQTGTGKAGDELIRFD